MITLTSQEIYDLFVHRKDVFATQQVKGMYFPTRRPITLDDIQNHINGTTTIGLYCLDHDNTIKWACVDIDGDPDAIEEMREQADVVYSLFPDFPRMLEFSGRKGFHIWIFFNPIKPAEYGQQIIKARLNRVGLNRFEVFPKQTELNEGRKYGNLVKLPLALHRVSGKKSTIIKMEGFK